MKLRAALERARRQAGGALARPGDGQAAAVGTLRATVRRPDGSPVAETTLALLDAAGHQVAGGVAGPDGVGDIPLPGPGEYLLTARHPGHRPAAATVAVPAIISLD